MTLPPSNDSIHHTGECTRCGWTGPRRTSLGQSAHDALAHVCPSSDREYPDGTFLPPISMRDATCAPIDVSTWTDEQIEAARAAAWAKTRELCQNPHTDMCMGDSDAITFAVLEALASSTTRKRDGA